MNKVSEKILNDAAAKAEEINERSKEEEKKIMDKHQQKISSIRKKQQQSLDSTHRAELNRLLAIGNLNHKKEILEAKWSVINDIFSGAEEKLKNDNNLYHTFLKAMIAKGTLTGNEKIIASTNETDLFDSKFLKTINDDVEKQLGHKTGIKLSSEKRETDGGIFLKEGKVEYNGTIDEATRSIQKNYIMEIQHILFGEES